MIIDWRGSTYDVGSTVLYPRMSGRSCEMQEGVVLEIKPYTTTRWARDAENKRVVEEYTAYKVKVQPTKSSREFRWCVEDAKPVWITIERNVTAV